MNDINMYPVSDDVADKEEYGLVEGGADAVMADGYEYEYEYVEVPEDDGKISEQDLINAPAHRVDDGSLKESIWADLDDEEPGDILKEQEDDLSLDEILGDVKAPVLDNVSLDTDFQPEAEVEETSLIPEIAAPAAETEDLGLPEITQVSADEKTGMIVNEEIHTEIRRYDETVQLDEVVQNKNEPSVFVRPEDIAFNNTAELGQEERQDWFSGLGKAPEVETNVNVDRLLNEDRFDRKASMKVDDYLEPKALVDVTQIERVDPQVADPESMEEIEDAKGDVGGYVNPEAVVNPAEVALEYYEEEAVGEPLIEASEAAVEYVEPQVKNEPAIEEYAAPADAGVSENMTEETEIEEYAAPAEAVSNTESVTENYGVSEEVSAVPEPIAEEIAAEIIVAEEPVIEASVSEDNIPVEETAIEPETVRQEIMPESASAGELILTEEEITVIEPETPIKEEIIQEFPVEEIQGTVIEKVSENMADNNSDAILGENIPEIAVSAVTDTARFESPTVDEQPVVRETDAREISVDNTDYMPQISAYNAAEVEALMPSLRLVSKNDRIQSFRANAEVNQLLLNEIDYAANELASWNLVLQTQKIMPLKDRVSELTLPADNRYGRLVTLVKNGQSKAEFYNENNLKIINASDACVAVDGKFICGDFGQDSGLIINDTFVLPLFDLAGKKLSFRCPASGFLSGPKGCLLSFFNLKALYIPGNDAAAVDADKLQYKISKWYSGTLNDKYFEFSASSPSAEFEATEDIKAIHVNVNNSSYGWNVAFDNGLSMNLRDLREYQTRFGKMPSPNGVISYGQTKLVFRNIEKVVVYESAQYFFYS